MLLPVLLLLLIGLTPGPALAADSDFEVSFSPFPVCLGYKGGEVEMIFRVSNVGATDITWVNVVVNTEAGYSHRWNVTIRPGMMRELEVDVPYSRRDLEKDRIIQISMNNNMTANPDGIKTFRLNVDFIDPLLGVSATRSPSRSTYKVGNTLTITHNYTNRATGLATTVGSDIRIVVGSRVLHSVHEAVTLMAGQTKQAAFRYTFTQEAAGEVRVIHATASHTPSRGSRRPSPSRDPRPSSPPR